MGPGSEFRPVREGNWSLLINPENWTPGLWAGILPHLTASSKDPSRHPKTIKIQYPPDISGRSFYLKIHNLSDPFGSIKDHFRASKAFRALKVGWDLCSEEFQTPTGVAAGERRTVRFVRQSFLLTLAVDGISLLRFLQERFADSLDGPSLKQKREYLKQFALEIRRMHQMGYVPGDLIPENILVHLQGKRVKFIYLDHDRTRRFPRWFLHGLWKRNLVQLNLHFTLAEISRWDRIRFLHIYLGPKTWGKKERRLIRWLDRKTRIKFEVWKTSKKKQSALLGGYNK